MAITDWPENERPREKLLKLGPQNLSDAELLAIFLRTGIAGKSAVDLARELLSHFGSLRDLLAATKSEFCNGKGLGIAKYSQLQAVLEMSARYNEEELSFSDAISSVKSAKQLAKARLAILPYEAFAVFFLDSQHRLICFDEVFRGTIDEAQVYPREIAKRALHANAAAVILTHNHPSGDARPSKADRDLTTQLIDVLALLDIRVLDHIIVGSGEPFSFAEGHLL